MGVVFQEEMSQLKELLLGLKFDGLSLCQGVNGKIRLNDVEVFKVEKLEAKVQRSFNLSNVHKLLPETQGEQISEDRHPERIAHRQLFI